MIDKVFDTIVAVATGSKKSGIGIVRLSGSLAYKIGTQIIKKEVEPRKVIYSRVFDNNGSVIDFGLVIFFSGPRSYTGEDVFEFHVHGNNLILDYLVFRSIEVGARLADPGEFTFRAFFNGKMDLLQAESVNQLINAQSLYTVKNILKSLDGEFSKKIIFILEILLNIRMDLEASIDFPDFIRLDMEQLYEKFLYLEKEFIVLMESISSINFCIDVIKVVILGSPNVGKSSLFNLIIGKDRSIVSHIPGTTRDYIDSDVNINNIIFKFIDTAGLNDKSQDFLENIGIRKSFEQLSLASIVIYVVDITKMDSVDFNFISENLFKTYSNIKKIFFIKNKIDLCNLEPKVVEKDKYIEIFMSVMQQKGFDLFMENFISFSLTLFNNSYVLCERNFNLLIDFRKSLFKVKKNFLDSSQIDVLAEDIRYMHSCLSRILGRDFNEEIITEIFSNFCLGK